MLNSDTQLAPSMGYDPAQMQNTGHWGWACDISQLSLRALTEWISPMCIIKGYEVALSALNTNQSPSYSSLLLPAHKKAIRGFKAEVAINRRDPLVSSKIKNVYG